MDPAANRASQAIYEVWLRGQFGLSNPVIVPDSQQTFLESFCPDDNNLSGQFTLAAAQRATLEEYLRWLRAREDVVCQGIVVRMNTFGTDVMDVQIGLSQAQVTIFNNEAHALDALQSPGLPLAQFYEVLFLRP
jgi:hypothetical protein